MSQKIKLRVVIVDLEQRIEAIFGQQHLVAALLEEDFCAATDRIAVIDDQHFGAHGAIARTLVCHQWFSSTT